MRTLYNLLWSDLNSHPKGNGEPIPNRHPEIALPYRIAASCLLEGFRRSTEPTAVVAWTFTEEVWSRLVCGRELQFGLKPTMPLPKTYPQIRQWDEDPLWCFLKHPAYNLPLIFPSDTRQPDFNFIWCELLQFLTAIQGSERVLDQLFDSAPGSIPYAERWDMRSRMFLPQELWNWIDAMTLEARGRTVLDLSLLRDLAEVYLVKHFEEVPIVLPDEFAGERVDVSLLDRHSLDFPCAIQRHPSPPKQTSLVSNPIGSNFTVRIAQVTAEVEWNSLPNRYPSFRRSEVAEIRRQIAAAFNSKDWDTWDFIIFPEVLLPPSERRFFENLVRFSKKPALIGCLWRQLPNSSGRIDLRSRIPRYLVNEALLSVPLPDENLRSSIVRSFLVRKPLPTHVEEAFALRLSEVAKCDGLYQILPGRRIYRFVHPIWGDFTVAICSDLIDPIPWASLEGEILHLLMCSYNIDVNLFEAITWVRAYENYVNVVAVNSGHCGGSFAWSPQSNDGKELARLRGPNMNLLADVKLPVAELLKQQHTGTFQAVEMQKARTWGGKKGKEEKKVFKAPPPGYPSRITQG